MDFINENLPDVEPPPPKRQRTLSPMTVKDDVSDFYGTPSKPVTDVEIEEPGASNLGQTEEHVKDVSTPPVEEVAAEPQHTEEHSMESEGHALPDDITLREEEPNETPIVTPVIPGLGLVEAVVAEEKSKEAPAPDTDTDGILDLLMRHVEAASSPPMSGHQQATPRAEEPVGRLEDPNPSSAQQDETVDVAGLQNGIEGSATMNTEGTPRLSGQDVAGEQIPESKEIEVQITTNTEMSPPIEMVSREDDMLETEQTTGEAEWEVDSSPIGSSSDSGSDSDSTSSGDSEDEDDDDEYAMLDPEEQARILMQGDGGSDDEGNEKSKNKGTDPQLRTANEKPEEVIPKPDILITEDMKIEELGTVEAVVEKTVLIRAKVSGEYQVLESGSLLCLENRNVVGVVAETLGRVQQPLYTVRFTNDAAIEEAGLSKTGTSVYYVHTHSTFVFTQPLKAVKGSDASNFHDEEVSEGEMEFSDDEAEAEYKRAAKLRKQGRKDEKGPRTNNGRGKRTSMYSMANDPHGQSNGTGSNDLDTSMQMNYDDTEDGEDGYTPLARPANLHEIIGQGEAPVEGWQPQSHTADRESNRGGGRGRGRDRGRGRGDGGFRGGRGGGRGRGGLENSNRGNDSRQTFYGSQHRSPSASSNAGTHSQMDPQSFSNSQNEHWRQNNSYSSASQQPATTPQRPQFNLPPIPPPSQHSYQQPGLPSFQFPPMPPMISPQPPTYPPFSPSPISPLPQQQFNFPNHHGTGAPRWLPPPQSEPQQFPSDQHRQMPPPGSHINPAFLNALRQHQGPGQAQNGPNPLNQTGGGGSNSWSVNEAATAQIQAQLEELRRKGGR